MEIRDFEIDDLTVLEKLKPEDWGDILNPHIFYLKNSFCYPKKVIINGTIAGIGTGIVFQNTGWLAHIIVSPKFRNQGIGSFIAKEALDRLNNIHNCTSISLIATDLGFNIYRKSGFRIQNEYVFLSQRPNFEDISDYPIGPNIKPYSKEYENSLFELDKTISGEDRSEIFKDHLDSAYISTEENEINGFFIPTLGEGFIVASKSESGLELLKIKMRTASSIVLPAENKAGIDFLMKNGFQKNKIVKRMLYGKEFKWEPHNIYSRIGGFFG
jgi:hypothetical protein